MNASNNYYWVISITTVSVAMVSVAMDKVPWAVLSSAALVASPDILCR